MRHIWLLVPAFLGVACAAEARPRDEALSGAVRCGVIADSRQWLDCFYGAAQPVRAGLGLAPALAAQIQLAAAPPQGGVPRDEALRSQVVTNAVACMREPAERSWLDCYYAAANPMRAQLGLAVGASAPRPALIPAPIPASMPAPIPASAPRPQLASAAPAPAAPPAPVKPPPMPKRVGILGGLFNDPRPVVRDVAMQSYSFDKNGAFTVTLPDGQVWEQIREDEIYHRARWRREASQMLVTIKPDVMHTYVLTIHDENRMYKVKRIR